MRETCYRCFWPKPLCWCPSIVAMPTRTRLVFLMHPKEYKHEKAATGRLTHLCLPNSELVMGIGFDTQARVQELIADPANLPVLLYPGREAINLSEAGSAERVRQLAGEDSARTLVVFVLDATWPLARKMLNLSPTLKRLPRVMFNASTPSRYVIKQQPLPGCLSTLEAVHELLTALAQAKLDEYPLPDQLLGLFERMQRFQIECALDPTRGGYRRAPYSDPGERKVFQGRSAKRRTKLFIPPASS